MKTIKGIFLLTVMLLTLYTLPSSAMITSEYPEKFEDGSHGARIMREFVEGMDPMEAEMIIDRQPDGSGHLNRIYMNLDRPLIGGVRLDNLSFEALDVQFNPVSEWGSSPVEVKDMLAVYAEGILLEDDINRSLQSREFGGDEHWHDLKLDFRSSGISAKGYYLAEFIFKLDILIEINGELAIRNKQQIWLDNYTLKVNRVDVPRRITDKAISKIQPILDLSRFIFPLDLDSVEMDSKQILIRSRYLPEKFDGIVYRYVNREAGK
ncbi:MAG: DUF2993 domain-containing protein [Synergistales bacterium]|nr:DUF2993 domain-containing protein [Synergistales bacterium]